VAKETCGITPRQAIIVSICSLIGGLVLYSLWGFIQIIFGGFPPEVYKVCGVIAKAGIYIAMAKAGLKLAPTYNRPRVWLFMIALVAILVNLVKEPSAGNIVLRSAQLFMTLTFLLVYRPAHEPFSRCPWKWSICTTAMVITAVLGYGATKVVSGPVFAPGWWWIAISLLGGIVMFTAVTVQVSKIVESDSLTFLGLYGLGNAIMVLSYLGQYNAAGMFLNSALSVLLLGKLVCKLSGKCKAKAELEPKKEPAMTA